jgi:hypothetical protein
MVLKYDLIIALIIIVTMVKNVHLLQPLFKPCDGLRRFLTALRNDMTFDLSFAILAQVVYLFIEVQYLLLFIFI